MNNPKSMKDPDLLDRYASDVIGTRPADFDGIEIQGVREIGVDQIEVDNENPEAYSVYLHYKPDMANNHMVGVQCCGDFAKAEDARAYAKELNEQHGWPITDFTTPGQ